MLVLVDYLSDLGGVVVAFSGGTDSSVLAKAAHLALGDRAFAVTFKTEVYSDRELANAVKVAAEIGINHKVVSYGVLGTHGFRLNPPDRCYHCKALMARMLKEAASDLGVEYVAEATTVDELRGHRPGAKAIAEAGVLSPFVELGMDGDDVRALARKWGIRVRPSGACLATRIPSGTRVSPELLRIVAESEGFVRSLGFRQVRVRALGARARVEVGDDELSRAESLQEELLAGLPFEEVEVAAYS